MLQEFIEETKKTAQEEVNNIHTVVPGEIVSFDSSKCLATVQPKMKFRQKNGEIKEYTVTDITIPKAHSKHHR